MTCVPMSTPATTGFSRPRLRIKRETVISWLTQYVEDLEARGTAHGTIIRYRGVLRHYVAPNLGKC